MNDYASQPAVTKHTVIVFPDKLASRSGGDRYKGILNGQPWAVYMPQDITRRVGKPHKIFRITIEEMEEIDDE